MGVDTQDMQCAFFFQGKEGADESAASRCLWWNSGSFTAHAGGFVSKYLMKRSDNLGSLDKARGKE